MSVPQRLTFQGKAQGRHPVDAPAGTSERGRAGRHTFAWLQLGPAGGSGVQRQTRARSGSPRGEGGGPFTHLLARAASAAATGHMPCGWTIRSLKARENPRAKGCRAGSGKSVLTLRGEGHVTLARVLWSPQQPLTT